MQIEMPANAVIIVNGQIIRRRSVHGGSDQSSPRQPRSVIPVPPNFLKFPSQLSNIFSSQCKASVNLDGNILPQPAIILHHTLRYIKTLLPMPNPCLLWEDALAGVALNLIITTRSIVSGIMSQTSPMHGTASGTKLQISLYYDIRQVV